MPLIIGSHRFDRNDLPLVMGVLNVTPDSFSDGGEFVHPDRAVARAMQMVGEGAAIIDIGPESTRPGSEPVGVDEQLARAVPVIAAIRARDERVAISIDTRLAPVARAAVEAGADLINDVSALRHDADMAGLVASAGVSVVLMHMKGSPEDMQRDGGPAYEDLIGELLAFFRERREHAIAAGIDPSRIVIDPGLGFGKRVEHNLTILDQLHRIVAPGCPVLLGASRKAFIGRVLGIDNPKDRVYGSVACAVIAAMAGVSIIRVHDVSETVHAIRLCRSIRGGRTDNAG